MTGSPTTRPSRRRCRCAPRRCRAHGTDATTTPCSRQVTPRRVGLHHRPDRAQVQRPPPPPPLAAVVARRPALTQPTPTPRTREGACDRDADHKHTMGSRLGRGATSSPGVGQAVFAHHTTDCLQEEPGLGALEDIPRRPAAIAACSVAGAASAVSTTTTRVPGQSWTI